MTEARRSTQCLGNGAPTDAAIPGSVWIRGFTTRRPLTAFLILVFGIGWPILAIPALASHGMIPGGKLPIEVFALGVTLLVMLPAALWVTSVTEGRRGV